MPENNGRPLIDGIGVWRISDEGERRKLGTLHADISQQDTIRANGAANNIRIVDWEDESNVSGGTPLDRRPYGRAIARVEDPDDPVMAIVFAYRSRHDREVIEGIQAIQRMDRAGGVLLVGGTTLTHRTAMKWAEATMGSVMSEWQRRELREAIAKGVAEAVADGRVPHTAMPLGLEAVDEHNHVRPVADEALLDIVRDAYAMRDRGETIDAVRLFLRENGYERSYRSVQRMLRSPLYIAQIRYGGKKRDDGSITPEYINDNLGYEPIVDPALWERVQSRHVIAGRNTKRPHLLARLGVLICGTCGARMTIVSRAARNGGKAYDYYRCGKGRINDCPAPPSIAVDVIDPFVIAAAIREVEDVVEGESAIREVRDADKKATALEDAAEDAEAKFVTLGKGKHTRARAAVDRLQDEAVAARAYADELRADLGEVEELGGAELLRSEDPADLVDQRALLRRVMSGRVIVSPDSTRGRTPVADRVRITPRGQARSATTA